MDVISDFEKHTISEFGTSYEDNKFKNGGFSHFTSYLWIKTKEGNRYRLAENWNLTSLKNSFDNYSSMKRVIEKTNSKGKLKKVTVWNCKVVLKDAISINDMKKALQSLSKKVMYYIASTKTSFFYVYDNFYKHNLNDEYLYLDVDNECFRKTDLYAGRGSTTKAVLEDWKIKNL